MPPISRQRCNNLRLQIVQLVAHLERNKALAVLPGRLYRNRDGRMISGVASGLADYFDVDPTLVRLVFILAALINGIGIFIYIVMSFIVPVREAQVLRDEAAGEEPLEMTETTREETHAPAGPPMTEAVNHWQHREQRHTWAGLILITLGVLFLAQNMGLLLWWNWRIFWPVVLIGVGALLLTRQLRR